MPSPLDPPSGCRLHTRCPYAREACKSVSMDLQFDAKGHANACAFWEELPSPQDLLPMREPRNPKLERLFAAFNTALDPAKARAKEATP
jgi:peptide/nickel transport system ATP-binding protein/oligopeptide transport system ATP-binding protein